MTATTAAGTTPLTRRPEWAALSAHYEQVKDLHLRQLFTDDPDRGTRLVAEGAGLYLDYSKNLVTDETLRLLLALAEATGVRGRIEAMFGGEPINTTEGRAVLHVALRAPRDARIEVDGEDVVPFVHQVLDKMADFSERVRSGAWTGQTGKPIRNVVNIGIGGSDLGPVMAYEALRFYADRGLTLRFVSNVDGTDFAEATRDLDPAETLFVVASKTFTTIETMTNARSARRWFDQQGGQDVARHFAALTTNVEAAAEFGIRRTFGFWDWVGGRYSMWSAIGLPIAIAVGAEGFRALLSGAHAMDEHFRAEPLERNLPVRLALVDVWYRNFHGYASRSVAPYHSALRRLPAYLQQLEMESNGKRVDRRGRALPYSSSPVVWGEPGTNGQHAYFQMLHQGTDVVPVEFIAVKKAAHGLEGHHPQLLANVLAQAQALMQGKEDAGGHRHFPGNRPSTILLLDRLDPQSLGALIALYEHRVFCAGALWGINSFDQWGVELGKVLAKEIAPRLASGDTSGLDASTAALVQRLHN